MKHIFLFFLVIVCFEVVSQDKKKQSSNYQVGFSYSINTSKNATVDRNASSKQPTLKLGEYYKQTSNILDTTSDFTLGVNLSKKLGIHTSIRVGVDYTKCYIGEYRSISNDNESIIDEKSIYYDRKFNFLDVPISWNIYLKKSKNEKLNLSCLMGVFPTFVFKSTNYITFINRKWDGYHSINTTIENQFIAKCNYSPVLLSADLGLKLEYNIFKKFSLNFQTIYRNRGNIKFKERYTSYMVNVGVGYNF